MSDSNLPNRIPFEDLNSVNTWSVPEVRGKTLEAKERQRKKMAVNKGKESIEDLDDGHNLKPMTAQQLQEMTESAEKEGFEKGYQEGLKKGTLSGEQQGFAAGEKKAFAQKIEELTHHANLLKNFHNALYEPLQQQDDLIENIILDMVAGLCKQLIGDELNSDPGKLLSIVNRVIDSLPIGAKNIVIHANPEDVSIIQDHCKTTKKEWSFIEDATISRGGLSIKTNDSLADFTVEGRLNEYIKMVRSDTKVNDDLIQAPVDYKTEASIDTEEQHSLSPQEHSTEDVSDIQADATDSDTEKEDKAQ